MVKFDFKSYDIVMINVEVRILECVVRFFLFVFFEFDIFIEIRSDYQSYILNIFECEIQFYLVSIEYFCNFQNVGLLFCIFEINVNNKNIIVINGFDLVFVYLFLKKKENVVCNDFQLWECECILVVFGFNQGGKIIFVRMIGQLYYLVLLGLYVFVEDVNLFLVDNIFIYFEKSENIYNFRGKLYDDFVWIKFIFDVVILKSFIIMNEIFILIILYDVLYFGI